MVNNLRNMVKSATGYPVKSTTTLHGGCIGEVYRLTLENDKSVVVKVDQGRNPKLDIEGYMLQYLKDHSKLPVPDIIHNSPSLLIMSFLEGKSQFPINAEKHAAKLLAELHQIKGQAFGLEKPTLIGGLHQPNSWNNSWISFFTEQRLLYMAQEAVRERRMPKSLYSRIETFTNNIEDFIQEPSFPVLLHGDVWTTNVLAMNNKITGFLDPAIYYGHPEIELAFITLFSTFGQAFFEQYEELNPIEPGFFDVRRNIYNLYPLLVHVRLFGSSYLTSVERTIGSLNF